MARSFNGGSTAYLVNTSFPKTVYDSGFTVAVRQKSATDAASTAGLLASRSGTTASGAGWAFKWEQWNNTGKLGCTIYYAGDAASTINSPTSECSLVMTHDSGTSCTIYQDTTSSSFSTATLGTCESDGIVIGSIYANSTYSDAYTGVLAEAAIWDTVLSAADVAILADGYAPTFVKPANLLSYWPLFGRASTEPDVWGSYPLTVGAGATQSAHPRIIYPSSRQLFVPPLPAAQRTELWLTGTTGKLHSFSAKDSASTFNPAWARGSNVLISPGVF